MNKQTPALELKDLLTITESKKNKQNILGILDDDDDDCMMFSDIDQSLQEKHIFQAFDSLFTCESCHTIFAAHALIRRECARCNKSNAGVRVYFCSTHGNMKKELLKSVRKCPVQNCGEALRVQCPHCERYFASTNFSRHLKSCAKQSGLPPAKKQKLSPKDSSEQKEPNEPSKHTSNDSHAEPEMCDIVALGDPFAYLQIHMMINFRAKNFEPVDNKKVFARYIPSDDSMPNEFDVTIKKYDNKNNTTFIVHVLHTSSTPSKGFIIFYIDSIPISKNIAFEFKSLDA